MKIFSSREGGSVLVSNPTLSLENFYQLNVVGLGGGGGGRGAVPQILIDACKPLNYTKIKRIYSRPPGSTARNIAIKLYFKKCPIVLAAVIVL